jgi:hypothetical protein
METVRDIQEGMEPFMQICFASVKSFFATNREIQ